MSEDQDIVAEMVASLRDQLPPELDDEAVKVLTEFARAAVQVYNDQAEKETLGYAELFEQKAKDNPLSIATPGLLMAAKMLRAAFMDEPPSTEEPS